ncbi:hypothetical protein M8J75_000952 [Diaphorina citri]|nr:hypothetical protein M8J75_000952 [Diaphorina citri]
MEDIAKNLEKKKPPLVHNAYNKLMRLLLNKKKSGAKFTRQSEEVVFLKDQCQSPCLAVSEGAFQTLLGCVQYNVLSVQDVLTILLSLSAHEKNLCQILHTILRLDPSHEVMKRCADGQDISAHPFVFVLKQCVTAWEPVLDVISLATSHFIPVFTHVLCTRDPLLNRAAKQSAWQLLTRLTTERAQVRVLLEHFAWYQSCTPNDDSAQSFLHHIYPSIVAIYPSYTALFMVYYTNLLVTTLETHSGNTVLLWQHIDTLLTKVLLFSQSSDINKDIRLTIIEEICPMTLLLLIQCIPYCDANNLRRVLATSTILIQNFSIDPVLSSACLMPLLSWLSSLSATGSGSSESSSYPSVTSNNSATSDHPSMTDRHSSALGSNPLATGSYESNEQRIRETLKCDIQRFIGLILTELSTADSPRTELTKGIKEEEGLDQEEDNNEETLCEDSQLLFTLNERVMTAQSLIRKLNSTPMHTWDTRYKDVPGYSLLIAGLLVSIYVPHNHNHDKTRDLRFATAWEFLISRDPSNAMYLLLYLLTRATHPLVIRHWLELLDNIPLILTTLESLSRTRDPSLNAFLVTLYTRLWTIEPRTFQFVLPLLSESAAGQATRGAAGAAKVWVYDVVRAAAMKTICETKPDIYGKELVPLLSSILSAYASPESSSAPATLALSAIRELCAADVVDFASVWSTLGVLRHDTRPRVLVSLIGLLECGAPSHSGDSSPESQELSYEISSVLWSYVAQNISDQVTGAAFRALSRFNFSSDYPLKYLHPSFRAGVRIPKTVLGKLHQDSKTPEEHLMYIPGECFLKLFSRVDFSSMSLQSDCCLYRHNTPDGTILHHNQSASSNLDQSQSAKFDESRGFKVKQSQSLFDQSKRFNLDQSEGSCASFVIFMTACIEQELHTYREIIYNSPYLDQSSKEPADYAYLPYKSILKALVKFIQTKIAAGPEATYDWQVLGALDILSRSYSKPLPPLNWSFLIHAYLKPDSAPSEQSTNRNQDSVSSAPNTAAFAPFVLKIAAHNCGFSQETCRQLAAYLRHCGPQQYFDSTLKLEYDCFLDYWNLKGELIQEPETAGDCRRELCSVPYALVSYFKGIKRCFTELGPKLTGFHLPPTSNLEANILYLATYVKQLFVEYGDIVYLNNMELFTKVIDCITAMPPVYQSALFSPLGDSRQYSCQLTRLSVHSMREGHAPFTMDTLYKHVDVNDTVLELIPFLLKDRTSQQGFEFIFQEIFGYIIQNKGIINKHIWHLLLLAVFSVSHHGHLLPQSVESFCQQLHSHTVLPQSKESIQSQNVLDGFDQMKDAFPWALVSMATKEQYNQMISYLTAVLKFNGLDPQIKVMLHISLLTLKSHISDSALPFVLSLCVSSKRS